MDWLVNLFTSNSIAHAVLILGLTIAVGLLLGRIKFGSVSLGITWVLFVGIVLSHFGLGIDPHGIDKEKEFAVIKSRKEAIFNAIVCYARKNDTVVLAGKGHENYEITAKGKLPFDEKSIAKNALLERSERFGRKGCKNEG